MNLKPAPDMEQRRPDLEEMVRQYGDGLLRMCFLYLRDVSLAEDAVQETFAAAWAKYDSFAGRSSEKTWLTAIAANLYHRVAFEGIVAAVDSLDGLSRLVAADIGEEPQPAHVDAHDGYLLTAHPGSRLEQRAVATERESHVGFKAVVVNQPVGLHAYLMALDGKRIELALDVHLVAMGGKTVEHPLDAARLIGLVGVPKDGKSHNYLVFACEVTHFP